MRRRTGTTDMDKPTTLRRVLGWREGAALTIASVLGTGVLYLPALTAENAGPAGLLAWFGMGLLIIPLALTLARLSTQTPDAGGIAAFVRTAFGAPGGAAAGWLFLGTVPLGAPIAALIGAGYLEAAFGWSAQVGVGVAALLLLVAVVLNVVGVQISGRAATMVVVLIALLLLAAVAIGSVHLRAANFLPFWPHGLVPVGTDLALLFWAFVGWEAVANYAEEFAHPARDLTRSMFISIAVIDVLYLLLAVVTVGTHAYGGARGQDALAVMLGQAAGRVGVAGTAILALLVTYGTIHAYVGSFARLAYAQARAGDFPPGLAALHARFHTPVRALLTLGAVFAVVLAIDAWHPFALSRLIGWSAAVFIGLYVLAMLAGMRTLPHRNERLTALLALVVCLGAMPFLGWDGVYPAGLAAVGVGVHALFHRRRVIRSGGYSPDQ